MNTVRFTLQILVAENRAANHVKDFRFFLGLVMFGKSEGIYIGAGSFMLNFFFILWS